MQQLASSAVVMRQDTESASHEPVTGIGSHDSGERRHMNDGRWPIARERGQKDWGVGKDIRDFIFSVLLLTQFVEERTESITIRIFNFICKEKNQNWGRSAWTVRW
jgi:hypothetical protein